MGAQKPEKTLKPLAGFVLSPSSVPKWDKNSCKLSPSWNWIVFFAMVLPLFVDLGGGCQGRGITERAPLEKFGW